MLADFGEILGNIFGGFGKLIEANFGPGTGGQYLLDWLIQATDKFANLDKLAGGSQNLSDYFLGASVNTQKVLSSVGALLREIVKAGSNPNIGKAFDILAEGAPAIGRILQKAADSGPAFARFVVQIVEFFDAFTDTRSIEIFWETVTIALKALNDILSNEFVKNILIAVSQAAALALALGSILKVGKFAFLAVVGSITFFTGAIDAAIAKVVAFNAISAKAGGGVRGFGAGIAAVGKKIAGPLGITALLAGVASGISRMSSEGRISEKTSQAMGRAFSDLANRTGSFGGSIRQAMDDVVNLGSNYPIVGVFFDAFGKDIVRTIAGMDSFAVKSTEFSDGTLGLVGVTGDFTKAMEELKGMVKELDEGLAGLASTNLPASTKAFRSLAESSSASNDELIKFLNELPGFKSELMAFAQANGLATDDQNLLTLALQKGPAVVRALQGEMDRMTASALDSSGKIQTLADGVRNMTQVFNDSLTDNLSYNESILNLSDSLAQNGKDFSNNTRAGIANQRAVLDVINASNEAAASSYEQSGSLQDLTSTLSKNRTALIDQLEPLMGSREAAAEYVATLMETPQELITRLGLQGIAESRTAVEQFILGVKNKGPINLPMTIRQAEAQKGISNVQKDGKKEIVAPVKADTTAADAAVSALQSRARTPQTMQVRTQIIGSSGRITVSSGKLTISSSAIGNLFEYLKGGLASFANGGMPTGMYKGRPGGLYKFAEPETRWEAFISGKIGQEKRNIGIWQEAGRRLGVYNEAAVGSMQSTFGSQGLSTQSLVQKQTATPKVENTIQITVNPSPGMDERELATMVSRRLAYELRRGTYRA